MRCERMRWCFLQCAFCTATTATTATARTKDRRAHCGASAQAHRIPSFQGGPAIFLRCSCDLIRRLRWTCWNLHCINGITEETRLKSCHSSGLQCQGIVHRDIKPENFMFGIKSRVWCLALAISRQWTMQQCDTMCVCSVFGVLSICAAQQCTAVSSSQIHHLYLIDFGLSKKCPLCIDRWLITLWTKLHSCHICHLPGTLIRSMCNFEHSWALLVLLGRVSDVSGSPVQDYIKIWQRLSDKDYLTFFSGPDNIWHFSLDLTISDIFLWTSTRDFFILSPPAPGMPLSTHTKGSSRAVAMTWRPWLSWKTDRTMWTSSPQIPLKNPRQVWGYNMI